MSLSKKFHQISSNTEKAEEIHENQIMIRDETSMGEISSCSSIMDAESESTLTSMSCEANGGAESTIPKSHSSTNMRGKSDIIFKISRETSSQRPLSYLKLSQVAYGKIKQGNKIKFFYHYSMA